jgi:NADH-quinone oxidoreductase subunit J
MDDRLPWLIAAGALLLLSALGVVLAKQPVHGAVALLANSLVLAATYLLLSAEFVAAGQVIIYSGAIVVLFLFVVLLLPHGGREGRPGTARWVAAATGAGTLLLALAFALLRAQPEPSGPVPGGAAPDGSVAAIGRSLFGPMLVPFELTTLPLLLAIVGAVTLWRRQEKGGR